MRDRERPGPSENQATWAIDSEHIRARGIIAKYSYSELLICLEFNTIVNLEDCVPGHVVGG